MKAPGPNLGPQLLYRLLRMEFTHFKNIYLYIYMERESVHVSMRAAGGGGGGREGVPGRLPADLTTPRS